MNAIIAAHIAVEAMRDQFAYRDQGYPDTAGERTARKSGLIRLLQSLPARLSRRSRRPAREVWGAR